LRILAKAASFLANLVAAQLFCYFASRQSNKSTTPWHRPPQAKKTSGLATAKLNPDSRGYNNP
jgi:hypothetical protein